MSFVMLTCTVGLLSGGWDLGWHQYTTSSHATTLESNKSEDGLYAIGNSTRLEFNKSHGPYCNYQPQGEQPWQDNLRSRIWRCSAISRTSRWACATPSTPSST